jgi:hypothetical protein
MLLVGICGDVIINLGIQQQGITQLSEKGIDSAK